MTTKQFSGYCPPRKNYPLSIIHYPFNFLLFVALLFASSLSAQTDSIQQIEGITIMGKGERNAVSTAAPLQTLDVKEMQELPATHLSDVLKLFSGIVVKDYGGVGGMKTVAMRGFGSQHTALAYDGLPVTDCQTGQIDLSKFALGNVEQVAVNSGIDDILLPARLQASANLIQIRTNRPSFSDKMPVNLDFHFTGGSFGLWNPSLVMENRILKHDYEKGNAISSSLKINYLQSDGHYPFTIYYGNQGDSTSREKRTNSDVKSMDIEGNLFCKIRHHSELDFKVYYGQSERGLPGAVIYYKTLPSEQRLYDQNAFGQVHFQKDFFKNDRKFIEYQLNAKFNFAKQRYYDPQYLNAAGFIHNRYLQREWYLSNGVAIHPHKVIDVALVNDLVFNNMSANLTGFSVPSRLQVLTILSAHLNTKFVTAKASVLHTGVVNWAKSGEPAQNRSRFSPAAGLSIQPVLAEKFFIRAFYKNVFRMPTFNDLYYTEVGNRNLNPEITHQLNLGITYAKSLMRNKIAISATADGYYNLVKDKIVAIPSRNLFTWSMLNYGKVKIGGMDATLTFNYQIIKQLEITLNGNYTLQKAIDVTDRASKTFAHQIPYTPLHSGSCSVLAHTPWFDLSYTMVAAGRRFALQQNVPENELAPYTDHSIALSKEFSIKEKAKIGAKVEMLNIADKHYEVIRNYPMQGRSVRASVWLSL